MIRVQAEDFDTGLELKKLVEGRHQIGGLCSFTGLVRELFPNSGSDQSMTLEHYPGMTEKKLAEVEQEALRRWDLQATLIIHRYGKLAPGEQIVLVAAAARHRQDTFGAAAFMMDFLKSKAPFWKLEEANGQGSWVDAREIDAQALDKWASSEIEN